MWARAITRRRFLAGVAVGSAAVALNAACGSDGDVEVTETATSAPPLPTPKPLQNGEAMFDSDGVRLHYTVSGSGFPLVVLHGWSSSYKDTWVDKGWIDLLTPIRQVIGLDQRGHGASDKPHEPAAYTPLVMAQDVMNLLDHLGVEKADIFGYSMGGGVAGALLGSHQERLRAVAMGGIGVNFIDPGSDHMAETFAPMIEALLADDPSTIPQSPAKTVRDFLASQNMDLKALAAWLATDHFGATSQQLAAVTVPVLVANAEGDVEGAQVAAKIAGAQFESIPGTNHQTVVPDQRYKDRVLRFLSEVAVA
jgi:pimeloyl-ACP methyl ester carboxylesterase